MQKVLLFSILLILGLGVSQYLPMLTGGITLVPEIVRILTMFCLGFIMIHVGYEFEIDRSHLRTYAWDYGIAATAAAFPWIFCSFYFLLILNAPGDWANFDSWKEALLAGRFAAPTSAGILFSMLVAAGLGATWYYRKIRVLAIFDDLDTVLFMIPLKMMLVGLKWQLGTVIIVMVGMLAMAWKFLHRVKLPVSWPWVMTYAGGITLVSELIYRFSKLIDDVVPIHIEVLLPAFVLGCMLARPKGADPHRNDALEGQQEGPVSANEQRVATWVSSIFMVMVGLSMPPLFGVDGTSYDLSTLAFHVIMITLLANLGKMFPIFCYRKEADWRKRLALCIGLWPRGEVGAGVLIISLSYGIGGMMVTVAALSLALNLLLTGIFILVIKKLLVISNAKLADQLIFKLEKRMG